MTSRLKPILVGEHNPYGSNPRYALYPEPRNSAGGRLCRHILGMTPREYLHTFDRVNLDQLAKDPRSSEMLNARPAVFLLGAKVCRAFHVEYAPWVDRGMVYTQGSCFRILVLPHPSGRCRTWNEPAAIPMTRQFVRNVLEGLPPHQERQE